MNKLKIIVISIKLIVAGRFTPEPPLVLAFFVTVPAFTPALQGATADIIKIISIFNELNDGGATVAHTPLTKQPT